MTTPPEYAAARHILGTPALAGRLAPYIADGDFDWPGIFTAAKTMSAGQRLLVRAAHDLWTADRSVGVTELTRQLDDAGFTRVMQAMRICRGETLTPARHPAPARPPPAHGQLTAPVPGVAASPAPSPAATAATRSRLSAPAPLYHPVSGGHAGHLS